MGGEQCLDFSKGPKGSSQSSLFTENGLTGMLQVSHLDSVDHVSPLFGATVDVTCGNNSSSEIIELFKSYVNLRMFLQKDSLCPFLSEQELTSLRKKIRNFKSKRRKVFGAYHAPNMGTQKKRFIDH